QGPSSVQQLGLDRIAVDRDREPCELLQEAPGPGFVDAPAPLVDNQYVAHLEPPQARDQGLVALEAVQGAGRLRMVFVIEGPAGRDGRIQHEGHQRRPSSRAESRSSTVTLPLPRPIARMASIAPRISALRRPGSGSRRAMARPW